MADAKGIRAGGAYVEVGADNSALKKKLDESKQKLREFRKQTEGSDSRSRAMRTAGEQPIAHDKGESTKSGAGFNFQVNEIDEIVARAATKKIGGEVAGRIFARYFPTAAGAAAAPAATAAIGTAASKAVATTGSSAIGAGLGASIPAATAAVRNFGTASVAAGTAASTSFAAFAAAALPIAAIVAGIGVTIYALNHPIKTIGLAFRGLASIAQAGFWVMKTAAMTVINTALLPLKLAVGAVGAAFRAAFAVASAAVSPIVGVVRSAASGVAATARALLVVPRGISSAFQSAGETLQGFGATLQSIGGGVSSVGKQIGAVGALVVAPLTYAAKQAADAGQKMQRLAAETGKSVEEISRLQFVADMTGHAVKELIEEMNKADKDSALNKQIRELSGVHDQMGIGQTTAGVAALAAFARAMAIGKTAAKALWHEIGSAVVPVLREQTEWLTAATVSAIKWVKEHKPLIVTAFKVASAVTAVGTGIYFAGKAFAGVGAVVSAAGTALGVVGSALSFLVSPLGLVGAAVAGLGYWFATSTGQGRAMVAELAAGFNALKTDAISAWDGITNAIAAGDLSLAFRVSLTAVQVEWAKLWQYLTARWVEFDTAFGPQWSQLWADVQTTAITAWTGLQSGWSTATTALMNAGDQLWTFLNTGWRNVTVTIAGHIQDMVQSATKAIGGLALTAALKLARIAEAIKNPLSAIGLRAAFAKIDDEQGGNPADAAAGKAVAVIQAAQDQAAMWARIRARGAADADAQFQLAQQKAAALEEIKAAHAERDSARALKNIEAEAAANLRVLEAERAFKNATDDAAIAAMQAWVDGTNAFGGAVAGTKIPGAGADTKAIGSFGGFNIGQGMLGGSSGTAAERTAKAAETTVKTQMELLAETKALTEEMRRLATGLAYA